MDNNVIKNEESDILVTLTPECIQCVSFQPMLEDDRTRYNFMGENDRLQKTFIGKCIFGCKHFLVCKRAIDSKRVMKLTAGEPGSYEEFVQKENIGYYYDR